MSVLVHDEADYRVTSRAVPLYQVVSKRTGRVTFETLDHAEALEKARETDPYYP